MFTFKQKPAYYSVHALRDGTIWLAVQTRKPRKTRHSNPQIDEDGIHNWFQNEEDPARMLDMGKTVLHVTVAMCLYTKRIIRQQVEPKLDGIIERIAELEEKIEGITEA